MPSREVLCAFAGDDVSSDCAGVGVAADGVDFLRVKIDGIGSGREEAKQYATTQKRPVTGSKSIESGGRQGTTCKEWFTRFELGLALQAKKAARLPRTCPLGFEKVPRVVAVLKYGLASEIGNGVEIRYTEGWGNNPVAAMRFVTPSEAMMKQMSLNARS